MLQERWRRRRDRLVEPGQSRDRDVPPASVLVGRGASGSYPVALGGLDGLLAGRRARAHAVGLLAVRGVSVGLAPRGRLDLVRVLPDRDRDRDLPRLPGEGEGAGPAGRGARDGAPEARPGLLTRAGRGRGQAVLGEGRGYDGDGPRPGFGARRGGQRPDHGAGRVGRGLVFWGGLGGAFGPWGGHGGTEGTGGGTWTVSEPHSSFSHIELFSP